MNLSIFLLPAIALTLIGLEILRPRRAPRPQKGMRWLAHGVLGAIGLGIGRLVGPLGMIGVAIFAGKHEIGLFNLVSLPLAIEIAATVILFDLALWVQHWGFHQLKWAWPSTACITPMTVWM